MAYRRRNQRYRSRRRQKSDYFDWAAYHEEKRAAIRSEYGGIDAEVEQCFFDLDEITLNKIFDDYAKQYGQNAKIYALKVYEKWKSGNVLMSGETSERLIKILPRYLSFSDRYDLIEKMWRNRNKRSLQVKISASESPDSAIKKIINVIEAENVQSLPEKLKSVLNWLTDADATIAEQLLAKIFDEERRLVLESLNREVLQISKLIHDANGSTIQSSHTFDLPGLNIYVTVEEQLKPRKQINFGDRWAGWIWVIIIVLFIILYALYHDVVQRNKIEYYGPYIPPVRHRSHR